MSDFTYKEPDDLIEDAELKLKYDIFLLVIDQEINSMNKRFYGLIMDSKHVIIVLDLSIHLSS
jgi:hypothetical protein